MKRLGGPLGGIISNQGSVSSGCEAGRSHSRQTRAMKPWYHENNRDVLKPLKNSREEYSWPFPSSVALNNSSAITNKGFIYLSARLPQLFQFHRRFTGPRSWQNKNRIWSSHSRYCHDSPHHPDFHGLGLTDRTNRRKKRVAFFWCSILVWRLGRAHGTVTVPLRITKWIMWGKGNT